MEGRFSSGQAKFLGAGVAGHACAACADQTQAHPCRDDSSRSRRRRVSPHLLPTLDLSGECDPRLAHPAQSGYEYGYAKEPVVNSELVKRRTVLEKRVAHLHRLAAESRKRLRQMCASDQVREEQVVSWEHRQQELLAQVTALEPLGQSHEPGLLAVKAQQLEAEWEVHHRHVLLAATSVARKRELNHCARSCRALRHVLRKPRRPPGVRTRNAGTR